MPVYYYRKISYHYVLSFFFFLKTNTMGRKLYLKSAKLFIRVLCRFSLACSYKTARYLFVCPYRYILNELWEIRWRHSIWYVLHVSHVLADIIFTNAFHRYKFNRTPWYNNMKIKRLKTFGASKCIKIIIWNTTRR